MQETGVPLVNKTDIIEKGRGRKEEVWDGEDQKKTGRRERERESSLVRYTFCILNDLLVGVYLSLCYNILLSILKYNILEQVGEHLQIAFQVTTITLAHGMSFKIKQKKI